MHASERRVEAEPSDKLAESLQVRDGVQLRMDDTSRCMATDWPQGPAGSSDLTVPVPGKFALDIDFLRMARIQNQNENLFGLAESFSKITAMSFETRPDLITLLLLYKY